MKTLNLLLGATLAFAGCAGTQPGGNTATADIRNALGQTVGTATFSEVTGGVRIVLEARNLAPGLRGVHIHEVGKCDPPAFTTAGGHFNPEKKQHGLENPAGPRAGDLPNMTVSAEGTGRLETITGRVTLGGGPTSLFDADGSALVVHAAADDMKTDPTGNSGSRMACGVIVRRSAGASGGSYKM
jgi:Cu-Zn family superoxide dismutase